MSNRKPKQKADIIIFQIISLLLLISFLEESEYNLVSTSALFAMLLLPIIIFIWFIYYPQKLSDNDKAIICVFLIFILFQIICIRSNALYTSLTPIYRSITVLLFILYAKRFKLCASKMKTIFVVSFAAFILGICTIFSPNDIGANSFYGNYNTVGALFFTLSIINFLIYLKSQWAIPFFLSLLCVSMVIFSNTRTALFLLIIILVLFLLLKILPKRIVKPKIIFPILLIFLIGFVWFYYNIKNLSIYSTLNDISKALFNKNFDSGRPDLWHMTVEAVGDNWLLGCGTGIDLEYFFPAVKTPHSVYFDIFLQNGLVGVLSYLLCIVVVINGKGKWIRNNFNIILISLAFVILFYNSVGIVFTKARSGIGLLQWALVALPYTFNSKNTAIKVLSNGKSGSSGLQCKTLY